jgi:hypothetical protein
MVRSGKTVKAPSPEVLSTETLSNLRKTTLTRGTTLNFIPIVCARPRKVHGAVADHREQSGLGAAAFLTIILTSFGSWSAVAG